MTVHGPDSEQPLISQQNWRLRAISKLFQKKPGPLPSLDSCNPRQQLSFCFSARDRPRSLLSTFCIASQLTPAAEANFPTLLLGFLPTFSSAFSISFGATTLRPGVLLTFGRAEPVSFKRFRALETPDLPTQPLNSVDTLPGVRPDSNNSRTVAVTVPIATPIFINISEKAIH